MGRFRKIGAMRLDYKEPISMKKYCLSDYIETQTDDWRGRTLLSQMIDVWGQANKALKHYLAFKKNKSKNEFDGLLDELKSVHRICLNIYNNPEVHDGAKWELKVWEWQQYDFYFWENKLHSTAKTVNSWIDHFMYDSNLNLV